MRNLSIRRIQHCGFIALITLAPLVVRAETTTSISQFGVTFHFSEARPYGQFANGEYWVLGPVTLTRIQPDFSNGNNGWEVNPKVRWEQGFQANGPGYDASLMPTLPYIASSSQSIVKVIGGDFRGSVVKTAVVLTVLMEPPPDDGADVFRPPYIGDSKPLYRVADLRTDLIPSYPPTGLPPSLESVVEKFSRCLRMDHHANFPRKFRPWDAMWDYQPGNTEDINNALLRLMLNDPIEEKRPAIIQVTQHALDRAYAVLNGYRRRDDGHNPNHRILAGWAAVLLDIAPVKDVLASAILHEDYYLSKLGTVALWGEPSSELAYWNYVMTGSGSRSNRDPYGYIDGGAHNRAGYQYIVSQSWKGQVLATHLMPALILSWRPIQWPILAEYVDRWVNFGVWTDPDPSAPFDGNRDNYGITFGPDSNDPGNFIRGNGRFMGSHGTSRDGGQYRSAFVAAMWDAYRGDAPTPVPSPTLSNVGASSVSAEGAVVSWTTDVPASGYVDFGTSVGYGATVGHADLLTQHAISLSGLAADTAYHYRVRSADADGATSVSGDFTFRTLPDPDQPPVEPPEPFAGLEGYWSLDEGQGLVASDRSGFGRDGTLLKTTGWRSEGRFGGALAFSAADADDYLDLGDFSVSGKQLTLAAWINVAAFGVDSRIIAKTTGHDYHLNYWVLEVTGGTANPQLGFRVHAGGSLSRIVGGALETGEWIHVAGVYDGTMMRLYQNGIEVAATAKSGDVRVGDAPVWVGDNPTNKERAFTGLIDELRVYSRALSPTEVAALSGSKPPAPLVGFGLSQE
jgi:hypothetical protein